MTSTKAEPDTRNLQWRQNNVGSTLLQKMGWKHGEALGSKHRQKDGGGSHSGEGIKVVKRQEGLGLGAETAVVNQESTSHASFSQLLETLKQEHGSTTSKSNPKKRKSQDGGGGSSKSGSKKKSKKTKETVFATNKITNARVRQSKFAAKTQEDMACIFGKEYSSGQIADETLQKRLKKQRKKEKREADKAEKKRKDREKE
jgi:G-patch domain